MPSMSNTRSETGRPVMPARSSAASSRSSSARRFARPVSESSNASRSSRARCSACPIAAATYSAAACRNSVSSELSGASPGAVAAHSSPHTSPSTMIGTPSSELRPVLAQPLGDRRHLVRIVSARQVRLALEQERLDRGERVERILLVRGEAHFAFRQHADVHEDLKRAPRPCRRARSTRPTRRVRPWPPRPPSRGSG